METNDFEKSKTLINEINKLLNPESLLQVDHQKSAETDRTNSKSDVEDIKIDQSYKNASYWSLPQNVRNAIDLAK